MAETFNIQQGEFEGPLEVLLDLIEKKKLSINEVSLKDVADGYIKHLEELSNIPVGQTAHFLLVASTLLLLKSISLLQFGHFFVWGGNGKGLSGKFQEVSFH